MFPAAAYYSVCNTWSVIVDVLSIKDIIEYTLDLGSLQGGLVGLKSLQLVCLKKPDRYDLYHITSSIHNIY